MKQLFLLNEIAAVQLLHGNKFRVALRYRLQLNRTHSSLGCGYPVHIRSGFGIEPAMEVVRNMFGPYHPNREALVKEEPIQDQGDYGFVVLLLVATQQINMDCGVQSMHSGVCSAG